MTAGNRRADSLVFKFSGTELQFLVPVGAIPGVYVEAVAGANGPGTGRIRSRGNGTLLSWKAPGGSFGHDVVAAADGTYLLQDGGSPAKWARVVVDASFLRPNPMESRILLGDVYANELAADDVTAAEASAGSTETYTITIENVSQTGLSNLVFWLDAAVSDLDISDDGATWVSPTSEATGLSLPDLAVGGTDILHLRRVIAASSTSDPDVLNHIHYSFNGR